MKAVWSDSLESGNDTIDDQHKKLFEHMNSFFDACGTGLSHESTIKTLNFLVKYVRFHFGTEEELMRKHCYPQFRAHLAAHRKIVEDLTICYKKLVADGTAEYVMPDLSLLLQEWFVGHIMGHDMELAKFLRKDV